jgi:two-component system, NarL family, response regulator LiaR
MYITVSIVEDDKKFNNLLKRIIEQDQTMICIAQYYNAHTASTGLLSSPPDVVLVDFQLPDDTGANIILKLKKQCPKTKFIVCTSFDDEVKILDALTKGADGYVLKSDTLPSIVNAIKETLNHNSPLSTVVSNKVVKHLYTTENSTQRLSVLSQQENNILELLSKGMLYKEMAMKLNVSIDTVKKHASNLYKKLQVSNRTEAINIYLKR